MAWNREKRELVRQLEQAVVAMPERTREVFLLHRLLGLGYPEIGERLGLSVGEVERHIAAAMLHLARALDESEGARGRRGEGNP